MKEIKSDTKGNILCSWIGRINIVKMIVTPKPIHRLNAIPINVSLALFTELEQKKKKIIIWMETQKAPNTQSNFEKERKLKE